MRHRVASLETLFIIPSYIRILKFHTPLKNVMSVHRRVTSADRCAASVSRAIAGDISKYDISDKIWEIWPCAETPFNMPQLAGNKYNFNLFKAVGLVLLKQAWQMLARASRLEEMKFSLLSRRSYQVRFFPKSWHDASRLEFYCQKVWQAVGSLQNPICWRRVTYNFCAFDRLYDIKLQTGSLSLSLLRLFASSFSGDK